MRIALIGGIYGKPESVRSTIQFTPETILERGLKAKGHEVVTFDHYSSIGAGQFDVVHVHHLGYGAPRLAVDGSNTPFVYTSHHGAAMGSSSAGLSRKIAAQFVMSRADAVVALSQAEANFQQRSYSLAGALHRVIPNGIDATNYGYARNNSAGKGRPWHLLYVGQLIAPKNVDVLLRALTQIKQPIAFELVYHNPELEIPLKKLAVKLGLNQRVHFLGPKSPRELAAIYQCADILVLPSAAEALPSVVTEAMLCGTPVVATDVGGVREQLGGYGVCISPACTDELTAAITCVLERYEEFAARSEAASAYAREQFSIESMIGRHLGLYADLLGKKRPRRRRRPSHIPMNAVLRAGVSLICATK